jgi:hypothetical protein
MLDQIVGVVSGTELDTNDVLSIAEGLTIFIEEAPSTA